jgi:hypothetical protein
MILAPSATPAPNIQNTYCIILIVLLFVFNLNCSIDFVNFSL